MSKDRGKAGSKKRPRRTDFEKAFSLNNSKKEKPVGNILRYFRELNNETVFEKDESSRCSFIIFSYTKTLRAYRRLLRGKKQIDNQSAMRLQALKKACERRHMFYRNFFIKKNLRLVVFMAKSYIGRGMEFDDLIQNGNLGLMRSLRKFDPRKGFAFSTYALWWIRQFIIRGFVHNKLIKIPAYIIERSPGLHRALLVLQDELGRNPTASELAKRANIKVTVAHALLQDMIPPLSLNVSAHDVSRQHKEGFIDILCDFGAPTPETVSIDIELKNAVRKSLLILPEREQEMLSMRYGLDDGESLTLDEIGRKFKLTRERIRQIERKALRTLFQNDKIRKELSPFLENIDHEEGVRVSYFDVLS